MSGAPWPAGQAGPASHTPQTPQSRALFHLTPTNLASHPLTQAWRGGPEAEAGRDPPTAAAPELCGPGRVPRGRSGPARAALTVAGSAERRRLAPQVEPVEAAAAPPLGGQRRHHGAELGRSAAAPRRTPAAAQRPAIRIGDTGGGGGLPPVLRLLPLLLSLRSPGGRAAGPGAAADSPGAPAAPAPSRRRPPLSARPGLPSAPRFSPAGFGPFGPPETPSGCCWPRGRAVLRWSGVRAGAEWHPGGAPSSPHREEITGERAGRAVGLFADTTLNTPAEAADRSSLRSLQHFCAKTLISTPSAVLKHTSRVDANKA